MFQSIKYLRYSFANNTCEYELVDSKFTCVAMASSLAWREAAEVGATGAVIKEYESRNLDVVKNLFLYNKWVCDNYKYTTDSQLSYLENYIDKYYPEIKFKQKYYDKLVAYTNKIMVLS